MFYIDVGLKQGKTTNLRIDSLRSVIYKQKK